jgi:hypothetical protein
MTALPRIRPAMHVFEVNCATSTVVTMRSMETGSAAEANPASTCSSSIQDDGICHAAL